MLRPRRSSRAPPVRGAGAPRRPNSRGRSRVPRRWLPPTLWAALTFTLTSIPRIGSYGPSLPGADKVVHATLYGVMAYLLFRAVLPAGVRTSRETGLVLALVAVISLVAWIDEWHQQFIPGRSRDTADWLADSAGAAICLLIASAARRREDFRP